MPSIETVNADIGSVQLMGCQTVPRLIKFAGAESYPEGCIMALDTTDETVIPYVVGGTTNGNGTPRYVLGKTVSSTVAANVPDDVIDYGKVRRDRLIILADGDNSNVSNAVVAELKNTGGIHAVENTSIAVNLA